MVHVVVAHVVICDHVVVVAVQAKFAVPARSVYLS